MLDRDGELLARLTSPNAAANARFGAAVAVDGETIVVGAPQEPTRYNNAAAVATVGGQRVSHGGAVYVFERPSRGWKSNSSPRATIVGHVDESRALPASQHDEVFARLRVGSSVAIDGDLLVVGVPGFSAYRVRSGAIAYAERDGAAFVFTRPSGGWTHVSTADATAALVAQDGAADDELGESVDIAPGGGSIVAGAPGQGDGVGAAYLFIRPSSGWSGIGSLIGGASAVKLVADEENDGAGFGSSVAVEDNTVVVAAPRADYQLRSAHGVAYVFRRPSAAGRSSTRPMWRTPRRARAACWGDPAPARRASSGPSESTSAARASWWPAKRARCSSSSAPRGSGRAGFARAARFARRAR